MKKLIAMMLLAVALVGCGSIEDKAMAQMKKTLKELANDPSSVEITNTDVLFSTDSLALIKCDFRASNAFGAKVKNSIEYVYYVGDEHAFENIRDLSKKRGSLITARESFDKMGYDTYGTDSTPSFYDYMKLYLVLDATVGGRKIK